MQLFYTDYIIEGMAMLTEEESQHVIKVLRYRNGDKLFVTDGMGTVYEGTIYEAAAKECRVNLEIIEKREKDTPELRVLIAPTKSRDRFENFIEKAVELGCTDIHPMWCDHSERKHGRADRWEKIALAAMKQSLHLYKPSVHAPTSFQNALAQAEDIPNRFIAWLGEEEESPAFETVYKSGEANVIAIGPEGDFSEDEVELAKAKGWQPVSLGTYRLRTETAGIACVASAKVLEEVRERASS